MPLTGGTAAEPARSQVQAKANRQLQKGLVVLLIGVVLWFLPVPHGLKPAAWHLFAVFAATLVGLIINPLPLGAMAFSSLTFCTLTGLFTPAEALSGFGSTTIWLIIAAFLFARSFMKTGLGRRIALLMIREIGGSALKLSYAMVFSDLVVSPVIPSASARVGGLLFPITRGLCSGLQSEPGPSARRIGAYMMQTAYQCDNVICGMFLTSMAANPLVAAFAKQIAGVEITWGTWALATSVPGMLTLLLIPLLLFKLSPPELKNTPEAKEFARSQLVELGPMSRDEKVATAVFLGCLLLWFTGNYTKLDATVVAMLGVSAMVATNVLEWKDITEEKGAWDTMVWVGSLLTLCTGLVRLGLIPWFAKSVSSGLTGMNWTWAVLILTLVYFYSHYGFASMTVHTTAMYGSFLAVAVAAGAPPLFVSLGLGFVASLSGGLTNFSGIAGTIYFGAGYVSQPEWWKSGLIVSFLNLIAFFGVGAIWWKVIGLW
jgi:DASS family divalent anion:Na+ symporter